MKSVLISIQPKWCELIASGKKTVEVRKTRPKIEVPFKCYIYCTKGETIYLPRDIFGNEALNGKVIGEFVCDSIRCEKEVADGLVDIVLERTSCVSARELVEYANGNVLYSWHISNLVIYDKPKSLREFKRSCPDNVHSCAMCRHGAYTGMKCTPLTRPPQSWCYVEGE